MFSIIFYGTSSFGQVDRIPGLLHVATTFAHLQFIPLFPRQTYVVLECLQVKDFVRLAGERVVAVPIPMCFKSVWCAWSRAVLIIAAGLLVVASVFAFLSGDLHSAAVGVLSSIACMSLCWMTYRLTRPSLFRALELGALLDLTPKEIKPYFDPSRSAIAGDEVRQATRAGPIAREIRGAAAFSISKELSSRADEEFGHLVFERRAMRMLERVLVFLGLLFFGMLLFSLGTASFVNAFTAEPFGTNALVRGLAVYLFCAGLGFAFWSRYRSSFLVHEFGIIRRRATRPLRLAFSEMSRCTVQTTADETPQWKVTFHSRPETGRLPIVYQAADVQTDADMRRLLLFVSQVAQPDSFVP